VGAAPNVLRVYQIRNPQAVFDRYEGYKAALQAQGRPVNEVRRFHATGMQCNFGVTQSQRPCDESSCAVCSIAASAFKLAYAGGGGLTPAFGFLRYGRGLYFSRTASKSHTYGAESERTRAGRKYRVMFLCKVALGHTLRTPSDRLDERQIDGEIVARAHGGRFDSVVGLTAADGGELNYEENVLYDEAAAIPSYLIVYQL